MAILKLRTPNLLSTIKYSVDCANGLILKDDELKILIKTYSLVALTRAMVSNPEFVK